MADAELAGPLGFDFGEVPEIVAKSLHRPTIEAGPKRGLRDGDAAGIGHPLVVVSDARDHVDMRVDVVHEENLSFRKINNSGEDRIIL